MARIVSYKSEKLAQKEATAWVMGKPGRIAYMRFHKGKKRCFRIHYVSGVEALFTPGIKAAYPRKR